MTLTRNNLITVHHGNEMKFWHYDAEAMPSGPWTEALVNAPPMEQPPDNEKYEAEIYSLRKVADAERTLRAKTGEDRLVGQVVQLEASPDYTEAVLVTSEGETWAFEFPAEVMTETNAEQQDEEDEEQEFVVETIELDTRLLTWFHTHPITDVCFVGHQGAQLGVSTDEGGLLRIWDVTNDSELKGFRLMRFSSALTSVSCDAAGAHLMVGSDMGTIRLIDVGDWKKPRLIDTQRISEAGIAMICTISREDGWQHAAALTFDNKIAFLAVIDSKLVMYGFVEVGGSVEDISWHGGGALPHMVEPGTTPKLLVAGSYHHLGSGEKWPCLWSIEAPPVDYDPTSLELRRDVCPISSMKLGERVTAVAAAVKDSVVIGFADGAVKMYPLPTMASLPSLKHPVGQATKELFKHNQAVSVINLSHDGSIMASASMDGSVHVKPLSDKDTRMPFSKTIHNPYQGGVIQMRLSGDGNVLISTGGSDGVTVWSGPGSGVQLKKLSDEADAPEGAEDEEDAVADDALEDEGEKDEKQYPVWAPETKDEKAATFDDGEDNATLMSQRKALLLEVEGLRKKLRALVDANSHCPELERLERSEFCVDFEERDRIAARTQERCNSLRAQIQKENLARQLIKERLVQEFWSPMKVPGCAVFSLMSNFSVSNYPDRSESEEETAQVRKLRMFREVELMEKEWATSKDCPAALKTDLILSAKQFASGNEKYIVNWWPPNPPKKGAKKETKENGDEGGAKTEDPDEEQSADQRLLYEPFELLTNCRRRLQIHLLQSTAREYRAAFNEIFKEGQEEKDKTMSTIQDKVHRIRSILAELQIEEEVPAPQANELETAESVLEVKDAEVKAEKWISPEEKKRLEEERLKEEERIRKLQENNPGQRALNQMMGGTLKTKKDLSALEITLDREPWMDEIPFDDMTEAQKLALKEFEEKEKALLEEQDKYRKQLDAELKKLRQEVQEEMQKFELELKKLHHNRYAHDAKFFCQELYCVRLQLALLQNLEDHNILQRYTKDTREAQIKMSGAEDKLEEFKKTVDAANAQQADRVRLERDLVTGFKAHFANSGLEPEAIAALNRLFRAKRNEKKDKSDPARRNTRRKSEAVGGVLSPDSDHKDASPTAPGSQMGATSRLDPFSEDSLADPYYDIGTTNSANDDNFIEEEPLRPEDRPEDCDEGSWRRMQELRRERLQAESESQRGAALIQEMNGLLAHIQKEFEERKAEYERLQEELAEHRRLMDQELYDIEILFKLKQGQVEVPQAAVVTDYSDAIVVDKEVVESRNRRILELGREKVSILSTIKEFRKKLNLIQWEHKMLALQTTDLEERTKDVHMLRVTKGLQSLLKGGEEGRNKADADLLERKIEHLNQTTQQKEASLKKQLAICNQATKQRKMENAMLEKKLRELQQNVIQREHIRRLRAPQGGGAAATGGKAGEKRRCIGGGGRIEENEAEIRGAQTNFRECRSRRALLDTAKRHTEEIDVLRKELERLRQKTFPSFVQLHEARPVNPDHK
eukprot:gnl/MRDRNA2_/MRDRNA2_90625_c0_seq1.p1 gnl/MRDRNA2_/MRDRNA2_90625_c0~~gnl/MRDRNA2_/MRDRNA2_90625_c0_seq1.p1  ORF type:complete len:1777 (-),score=461.31 gnl/MRDRNA2_/MRDRNA2_90625_c0_seq1:168-4700(-)